LVSSYEIKENVQHLFANISHEEQIYRIVEMFIEIFPVNNAFLFRYSPFGYLGEGVLAIRGKQYEPIQEIREDLRSLPLILSTIRKKRAQFFSGKDIYLKHPIVKYKENINNQLIIPISSYNIVKGYIVSVEILDTESINENLLDCATLYGQLVGKIIESSIDSENLILSKRELEVMRRIAEGDSTKEMANSMNLSEFTVKQYVKSSLTKLGVQNRAHAIAELFRRGLLL